MAKLFFVSILLLIITYAECSKCTDFNNNENTKKQENTQIDDANNEPNNPQGDNSDEEPPVNPGGDNPNEQPPVNSGGDNPDEQSPVNPGDDNPDEQPSVNPGDDNLDEQPSVDPQNLDNRRVRRRLVNEVSEKDCKGLDTRDNSKYQCVVNKDHKGCEEISIEGANILKISLSILLLLLFI